MTTTDDLVVIGAGMAGVAAANKCASQDWQVAIVDAQPTAAPAPCVAATPRRSFDAAPRSSTARG